MTTDVVGRKPPTAARAGWALVAAIFALGPIPILLSFVAWNVADSAERDIDASDGALGGRKAVRAARVIAWIALGLDALYLSILLTALGAWWMVPTLIICAIAMWWVVKDSTKPQPPSCGCEKCLADWEERTQQSHA